VALFLIDTNDLEAILPDPESRKQVIDDLRKIGRSIADAPAAIVLQRAEAELETARKKAVEPSPEMLKIIERDPKVVAATKQLEDLRRSLGLL